LYGASMVSSFFLCLLLTLQLFALSREKILYLKS
jgi:hypothetical protein